MKSQPAFISSPGSACLLFLFLLLCCAQQVFAQEPSGGITGRVVDRATQEPIAGAIITLQSTSIGAAANVDGVFEIRNIPIGTYQVQVSSLGYVPLVLSDIVVAAGRLIDLAVRLEQTAIDIDAVEIVGSYFQDDPDATVSAQRLSYEEIRRSPGGFEDVVRAISVLPGVAVAEPGRNDLVVRGGAPSENLFVIDNIEISNINHFGTQGAGGGPLSYVNLDFVRETAFSTGGFGVRYGDKLSSVLTIDLQDGRRDKLGGKATISASQFGLNMQGPLNNNATFIFSARRSYLDFIFRAAGFSFVPEYWDFLGRISYRLDQSNNLTFLAIGAVDDVNFIDQDADDRFDNSRILGTAQRQYVSGVTWQHLYGTGFSRVTLGRTYVNYNGIQRDSLLSPIFTNKSIEGETSLRADMVVKPGKTSELSFGGQAKRVNFTTSLALPQYRTTFGDTLDLNIQGYSSTSYKASGYLQLSQQLFRDIDFTFGGRLDYFGLLSNATYLSPRVSVGYRISEITSLTATAGVYRQNPSYIWLVANPENRSLRAVRADQYVLSLEHLLNADLKVRIEGFYKRYTDYPASLRRTYLVLANTGGGFGGSDENFASFGLDQLASDGRGMSQGVELLVQKKLSDVPVYGILSLTLSRTRFTAIDGMERPGAFDQEVIANISGGYRFDDRWEASMKFRYASGQPYTPFRSDGTQDEAAYNSLRVKSAHALDVRVDRRWNFSSWNLIVYLDIQNVYNNKFSGGVRWNAREQRADFDESSIGILPTIGISAEF